MFVGRYTSKCKDKNRIVFPQKFKIETGNSLLITNWFENSLMILPNTLWEEVVEGIFKDTSLLLPDVREMDRFIFGGTYNIELDAEGRFVLPLFLKEHAKINRDVIFIGGMWYIQLWDESIFENYQTLISLQIKEKAIRVFERSKNTQK